MRRGTRIGKRLEVEKFWKLGGIKSVGWVRSWKNGAFVMNKRFIAWYTDDNESSPHNSFVGKISLINYRMAGFSVLKEVNFDTAQNQSVTWGRLFQIQTA